MAMGQKKEDFKKFLANELAKRRRQRPNFSLRMFASFLKIEPSLLSKILRGQRAVTLHMLQRLGPKLKLSQEQMDHFRHSIYKKTKVKNPSIIPTIKVKEVTAELFSPISEWYFAAILEATSLRHFEPTSHWISKNLRVELSTAASALKTLEQLNFFRKNEFGQLVLNHQFNSVLPNPKTTPELRKIQKQFLNKALSAVDEVPVDLRDQATVVVAIPLSRLPEAKEHLKKFRRKLMKLLQRPGERDAVYQLALSLTPLTKFETENGEELL